MRSKISSIGRQLHFSQFYDSEPGSAWGVERDRPLSVQWVLITTLESCHQSPQAQITEIIIISGS